MNGFAKFAQTPEQIEENNRKYAEAQAQKRAEAEEAAAARAEIVAKNQAMHAKLAAERAANTPAPTLQERARSLKYSSRPAGMSAELAEDLGLGFSDSSGFHTYLNA